MNEESERVIAWREENRHRYNEYMRSLRKTNPDINLREDLRKAKLRAERAGRPFDEEEWLSKREHRKQRRPQRHR